ncbi:MAG: ethanolamine ammonia-lyase subunit EutC [Bryobacteraceae bacterium]|jgi:ethanolamine ammonia-lyase small subunit
MRSLRDFTMARVGLERAGAALATREVLAFQLAHAAARDAVHQSLDRVSLQIACAERNWPLVTLHSAAADRTVYLRRPDLGRRLDELSREALVGNDPCDIAAVLVDGLSALAVERHALPLLDLLLPLFDDAGWSRADLALVEQGRVAIGDEIGLALHASLALVLIGERPGLSAPDSLGAYLTCHPTPGRTDAERNCVSNIRPDGLGYREAADRIFALASEARRRKFTGVGLKEDHATLGDGRH